MTDEKYMEMVVDKLNGEKDPEKVLEILEELPDGETKVVEHEYKGVSVNAKCSQKFIATMKHLHNVDAVEETKELLGYEIKTKLGENI